MNPNVPAAADRRPLAWLLLAIFYLFFAFLYSVIQPPTAPPDEGANMQYVRFLSDARRLPVWQPSGGGEGGYETQHPPLAYAMQSLVWSAFGSLPENLRWHAVRWFMVLLGLSLLPITARLGRRLFPASFLPQFTFAAALQLSPLSLLYFSHANPDGVGLILSALGLLIAVRIYTDTEQPRWLPWAAGLAAALAALTKLSVAPIGLVLLAAQWLRPGQSVRNRLRRSGTLLGVWLVGAGGWYGRNFVLYGQPFLHTIGRHGSGLGLGARGGMGLTAAYTLSETFFSLWAQRGWLPYVLQIPVYGLAALLVIFAGAGFTRKSASVGADRFALRASLFLFLFVLLGQQAAFWLVDEELNAGGRYLLAALPAIVYLLMAGISRFGPRVSTPVFFLWIGLLLVMNFASVWNIVTVLTPHYFPGWKMLEFPGGSP